MAGKNIFRMRLRQFFCGSRESFAPRAKISSQVLIHGQIAREYLLALPHQACDGKRPLLILLHGGAGASATQIMGLSFPPSPLSVWLEVAEREQLIVIAPNGSKMGWNDSFADIAHKPATDDVGFISALISHAIENLQADATRVYVMGVSKGGMMAYRLAIEIGHKLAAFSAVLANLPVNSICEEPQCPISALIIASTKDPLVPYRGGKFFYTPGLGPMKSIAETVEVWRRLAQLPGTPRKSTFMNLDARTSATRFDWLGENSDLQLSLIEVAGAGHTEPSSRQRYPGMITSLVGAQNADFEVAEVAWEFFRNKTRS